MAGSDEMAIGNASALASVTLDPLPVQLRGLSLDAAAYLVRAVVRKCADAGISLHSVKVDAGLFAWLIADDAPTLACTLSTNSAPGDAAAFLCRKQDQDLVGEPP